MGCDVKGLIKKDRAVIQCALPVLWEVSIKEA